MDINKDKKNKVKNKVRPDTAFAAVNKAKMGSTGGLPGSNAGLKKNNMDIRPGANNQERFTETIGAYLQNARVKAGYSLNQVAMITKIHIHYLEAIERDDFKSTPPFIYVKAYIKRLCSLYNIDERTTLGRLKNFDKSTTHVSNAIIQELEGTRQVDKKEEDKVKLYVRLVSGLIAVLVIVIIVIVCIYSFKGKSGSLTDKPLTVEQKQELKLNMGKLIAPQFIAVSELNPPKS